MTSPLKLVQILLSGLGNRSNSGPIAIRPRIFGSPTADRVLSGMRNGPIDSDTDYDPDSVTPDFRPTTPHIAGLETRAREVNPPDQMTKLEQEGNWIASGENHGRDGSIIAQPTRLKSGLLQALSGIGEAARRNMATGRTDWKDLAGVAGAGAGGFGVGAAKPSLIVKARHQQAVEENAQEQAAELQRQNAKSVINARNAEAAYKQSLPEKAARDQELRQSDIARKQAYQDASLKIRQDALNGRISYQEWQRQQKELDRQFNQDKFEETKRHNQANEGIATSNAESNRIRALKPPAGSADTQDALDRANDLQSQIDELNAQDKKESAYEPALDSKTKEVMTDAKGGVIYSNDFTEAYKQRQAQKKVLMAEKEKLFTEARKAKAKSSSTYAAQKGTFSIRQAIKNGLSEVEARAKAARAKAAGWQVVD